MTLLVIVLVSILYLYLQAQTNKSSEPTIANYQDEKDIDCTPTFMDGGGPYYQPNIPFRDMIAPDENNGDSLVVEGRILQNDCETPVANATLDIWQANESGNYEDEWYRGKVKTDSKGNYTFETVVPQGYGEGTGYRPPHIHFKVHINGNVVVTSQMFFPEAKGKPGFDDAYIMKVEESGDQLLGYHDIILP